MTILLKNYNFNLSYPCLLYWEFKKEITEQHLVKKTWLPDSNPADSDVS